MIKEHQQQVFFEENMSNLTSAVSGEASVSSSTHQHQHYFSQQNDSQDHPQPPQDQPPAKRKRSLPGHPDPDAEVIAMSPKSLLAKNRFVCEICNKGFQRDQNLQLHRRGHNLPWKLKQRSSREIRKKVYVCPEPSCVHHDPARALGDLTGIKKHFCRKHGEKKWKCDKCSKKYAVQSDWKAHSKICGTREYRCDCGTLFSRRDSYITHRAFCDALAEETTRGIIPTNPQLLSNHPMAAMAGTGPSSTSSNLFMNQQQPQLVFNPRSNDPLLSFPLKREQPQFDHHQNLLNLPPWLTNPPLPASPFDHHQNPIQNQNISASSSSSIFDHQQQMMQQTPPSEGAPYHTQAHPQMSATALLQRAAQIGATMSSNSTKNEGQHQQGGHVTDTNSTAGFFGLNLSTRDHPHQNNQQEQLMNINNTCPSTSSSSSLFHDMMMNSLSTSSAYEPHDNGFGIGGMLKKEASSFGAFHQTPGGGDFRPINGNGSVGGGNDGMTRDFLGLRPLSQNDILTLAGLGNCITTTNPTSHEDHTHNNKPWQG